MYGQLRQELTWPKFLVRGVVYQLAFDRFGGDKHDAISDHRLSRLEADLELFKELGINTIFVCRSQASMLPFSGS
jgi:hypothetical protein